MYGCVCVCTMTIQEFKEYRERIASEFARVVTCGQTVVYMS